MPPCRTMSPSLWTFWSRCRAAAPWPSAARALGSHDARSDWDLGLYYRGAIDLTALATRWMPGMISAK